MTIPNFIDEYLIKLGASVDSIGLSKFSAALSEVTGKAETTIAGLAKRVLAVETELTAGFVAIGSAAVGIVDKVAMADQEFRLFALHMYLGKEEGRALKITMDALGQSLENIAWDPTGELQERARQLIADQRTMAPEGDFNEQMRKIRDIRFEFTRMEVELQYLGMHVVQDFMRALGLGPDTLLAKLRQFNDWVTYTLPQISQRLVKDFLPVWRDIEHIMTDVLQVSADAAQVFTNIIGLISGDSALEGTVSFDKFAAAVEKVTHWIAVATDFLMQFVGLLSGTLVGGTVGGLLGSIIGGVAGVPGGPAGIIAGVIAGGATGTAIGAGAGAVTGGSFDLYRHLHPAQLALPGGSSSDLASEARGLAQQVSSSTGIAPDLLWAQWAHETNGFTHLGAANNLAGINVPGGTGADYRAFNSLADFGEYYAHLMNSQRYAGVASAKDAVDFAHRLKVGGYYSDTEANYAGGVSRYDRMYKAGSNVTIHMPITVSVSNTNASAKQIAEETGKRVQRNLDEAQQLAWGY